MKQYKYFIYDLDGTLVDSSPSIYSSIRHTEKTEGLTPVADEQLHCFVGPPLADLFKRFYNVEGDRLQRLLDAYRDDYGNSSYVMTKNYPYVEEQLRYIKANGCFAAVATLKNRGAADVTLRHSGLLDYLDYVAAPTDKHPRSKGELILDCLEHFGTPPREQAVFFGDSPYDGVGASEAGVDFIALTYGFGFLDPGSFNGINTLMKAAEPQELFEFVKRTAKA